MPTIQDVRSTAKIDWAATIVRTLCESYKGYRCVGFSTAEAKGIVLESTIAGPQTRESFAKMIPLLETEL